MASIEEQQAYGIAEWGYYCEACDETNDLRSSCVLCSEQSEASDEQQPEEARVVKVPITRTLLGPW